MSKPRCISALIGLALAVMVAESQAQIAVTSPIVQERWARPGKTYAGKILVRNTTAQPQEAKVYQADYEYFVDGRSRYPAPGGLPRSNASWIAFAPSTLRLLPGEVAEVSYSVRVPEGVDPPLSGTYWSVLMVEAVVADAPEAERIAAGGPVWMGVGTKLRYAVQVATHIAGTGSRGAAFEGTRVLATGGGRVLEFDVANTGDLAYRLDIRLELYDSDGNPVRELADSRGLLYPGAKLRQRFDLTGLAPGSYTALILADTGTEDVFGAQYVLKL